ncbi:MAG: hypothetical protein AB1646_09515 [Thermodesulfobacteriota bacterium]
MRGLLDLGRGLGKMGLAAILVVSVCGCVSVFGQRVRDKPHEPPASEKKGSESDSRVSKRSPGTASREGAHENPAKPSPPVSGESAKPEPISGKGSPQPRKTGDSEHAGSGASGRSLGPDEKLAPDHNPEDKVNAFDKYDHNKYARSLKEKAIEMVSKDANAFYARLCTDALDVSTLTTYRKQSGNTLAMTTFVWDPIDQMWHKTVSEKIRLPEWKTHLSVSASGKACEVLKGTEAGAHD